MMRPLYLKILSWVAAVLLASEEKAKALSKKPVWVAGLCLATDTMRIGDRKSLTSILSSREAAKAAYRMAGVGPSNINVATVHGRA